MYFSVIASIIAGTIVMVAGLTRLTGESLAAGWQLTEMTDGSYAYVNLMGQDGVRQIGLHVSRQAGSRVYVGTTPARIGVVNVSVGMTPCVVSGVDRVTGLQEIRGIPDTRGVIWMWVRQTNVGVRIPTVVTGDTLAGWVREVDWGCIGCGSDGWIVILSVLTGAPMLVAGFVAWLVRRGGSIR